MNEKSKNTQNKTIVLIFDHIIIHIFLQWKWFVHVIKYKYQNYNIIMRVINYASRINVNNICIHILIYNTICKHD